MKSRFLHSAAHDQTVSYSGRNDVALKGCGERDVEMTWAWRECGGRDAALGHDLEGTHHVVGFVLKDVAVVEIFARVAFEADDDAGYGGVRALNGVLPA
jgi:hypothetical protein